MKTSEVFPQRIKRRCPTIANSGYSQRSPILIALRAVEPHGGALSSCVLLIALAVLVVFLFGGEQVLRAFHISEPSLSIAGGVILFLIALRMIFPRPESTFGDFPDKEPFIVRSPCRILPLPPRLPPSFSTLDGVRAFLHLRAGFRL